MGTNNNCDISSSKATVSFENVTGGYKIKSGSLYLTVDTTTSDLNVYWATSSSSNYQVWALSSLPNSEIDYIRFLDGISSFESSNAGNYQAVNPSSGALGRYQVLPSILRAHSEYANVSDTEFLNNPAMQETFIRMYHRENWSYIKSYNVNNRIGSVFNGALITAAGLLALAGFGIGNLMNTLSGSSTTYKSEITARLNYFQSYNIAYITG